MSTPVTHVLTLAITGLLLIGLVNGAGGFLKDQQQFAARDELDTVGNRLATELQRVGSLAQDSGSATIYVTQPSKIVGHEYRARLAHASDCHTNTFETETCLVLSLEDLHLQQKFPLSAATGTSFRLFRTDTTTYNLTAVETGTHGSSSVVVPMSRTMRVGAGKNVDNNAYSEVVDPTNNPPVPKFNVRPDYPESTDVVTLDASSSSDDIGIRSYQWYVDGAKVGPDAVTYDRNFDPGVHNVSLVVTDLGGKTATATPQKLRVSGLAYDNNLVGDSGGASRCGGVAATFSMTNRWTKQITITDLSLDPADNVNKIEYNSGAEIAFKIGSGGSWAKYDTGTISLKDKPDGTLLSLRQYGSPIDLDPGESVTASICKFKGGGNLKGQDAAETSFGFQYWVDGVSHRTIIDGSGSGQMLYNYDVGSTGSAVQVSFDSGSKLGSLSGAIGSGAAHSSISLSDFTRTNTGGTYHYEASFGRSSGTYYARIDSATDSKGNAAKTLPLNETTTILGGGTYTWQTASDWDGAQSSVGVVHQNFGDYASDTVTLGRPPGSVDSSLVSYWPLDGTATDVYGSNDGTIHGASTSSQGIDGSQALRFDGNSDYISIPDDSSLEMSDNDRVTVSMWVNKHRQGSGWTALFQKSDRSYNMQFIDGDNFVFTIYDGSWQWTDGTDLDTSLDKYYHLVGTFDGATVRSYVDGSQTGTNGGPNRIGDASGSDVGIGKNLETGGRNVDATIDDVRIYDDALSAAQVKKLHNVTKGSIVTDKRTGSTIDKHHSVKVNYDAAIKSGQSITLTVYADPGNGNVVSDSVVLHAGDSGTNSVSLDGINKDADTFWVRADLRSSSSRSSPELHAVELSEGT